MPTISIFIDADACPVKPEAYRVAERHALKGTAMKVLIVGNSPIAVPRYKDAVALYRHGRTCSGHPRLCFGWALKTWMPATSPRITAVR